MTVQVFMKNNEKVKYHKDLFENYHLGLYKTIQNVSLIKDFYLDYRFFDKDKNVLSSINKEQFYFSVCE